MPFFTTFHLPKFTLRRRARKNLKLNTSIYKYVVEVDGFSLKFYGYTSLQANTICKKLIILCSPLFCFLLMMSWQTVYNNKKPKFNRLSRLVIKNYVIICFSVNGKNFLCFHSYFYFINIFRPWIYFSRVDYLILGLILHLLLFYVLFAPCFCKNTFFAFVWYCFDSLTNFTIS